MKIKMTITVISIVVVVLLSLFSLNKLKESSKWLSVKGVILQSEREMIPSPSRAGSDYNLIIQYWYQVNNKEYVGNRLMAGLPNLVSSQIIGGLLMKTYLVGDEINIFYNPDSPNDAVLVTGKDIPTIGYILFFLFQVIAVFLSIFISSPSYLIK